MDFLGILFGWEHCVVLSLKDQIIFFNVVIAFKQCLYLSDLRLCPFSIETQDISRITGVVRAVNEQKGSSFGNSLER